jgi:transposase
MSGISKIINESLYNNVKEALKEVARSGDVSRKLQAIKSAKEHGISKVSDIFGVSRVTIMTWIKDFREFGADGLKLKSGRGRKSILSNEEIEKVKAWIKEDSGITINRVRLKIEEFFNKTLSVGATHNLLKKLKFSYITPRPSHYKKDASSHEEFKKKSSSKM